MSFVPYKSVAAALILTIIFGPLGLFYASFIGGILMTFLSIAAIGTMTSMHSPLPMATMYLVSMIWAMASVRWYNYRLLKIAIEGRMYEQQPFWRRKG
ncbi:MAG: hypothetical protein LRY67_00195 [Gammaproteobacteria bacterium]|nr:hypothetical protein [Gammaproteobacteria bacterium]MCD8524230.1 hypothetical protein [Gammaproteobacteria bacterium]MCD8542786.1 hypothetical protein [Gammaproteobacteria bacterium]MCD8573800.1 hypothetical protein [Gammaproteobacteria bacterium]